MVEQDIWHGPVHTHREVHGRKEHSVAHVSQAEGTSNQEQKKIEDLRQELHHAELAAAMKDAAGIIRSVVHSDGSLRSELGPTITSKVEVNGVSTDALVDTGSPATIISLDFAMVVMAKERPKFSSVEEWMSATQEKFETPTVTLKNYGGERLDFWHNYPYVSLRVDTRSR